jgi:hypothetical protein
MANPPGTERILFYKLSDYWITANLFLKLKLKKAKHGIWLRNTYSLKNGLILSRKLAGALSGFRVLSSTKTRVVSATDNNSLS